MGFPTEDLGELQRLKRLRAGGACRDRFEGPRCPRALVPLFEAVVVVGIANSYELVAPPGEAACL